jgi:cyclopropane-fatty-acyl-phospholipid synthase
MRIVKRTDVVCLRKTLFDTTAALLRAIEVACSDKTNDFVEGVAFGVTGGVLMTARCVAGAPANTALSDYTLTRRFYESIVVEGDDFLTTDGYLWRWDTDWFWVSQIFPGLRSSTFRRLLGPKRLGSASYKRFNDKVERIKGALGLANGEELVIQDIEIPYRNSEIWLRWYHETLPAGKCVLAGQRPIWLCPFIGKQNSTCYPTHPELYMNFGAWDVHRSPAAGHWNRALEQKCIALDGVKTLYADVFLDRETFDEQYRQDEFRALKAKYDPNGKFRMPYDKVTPRAANPSLFQRFCQVVVERCYLNKVKIGCLTLQFVDGTKKSYGDATSPLQATLYIESHNAFQRMVTKDTIGLADAYMAGEWRCDDLVGMVCVILENMKAGIQMGPPFTWLVAQIQGTWRWLKRNTIKMSTENVRAHYDIGNDFYKLWLDPTMTYTCALFRDPKSHTYIQIPPGFDRFTLKEAQENKIDLLIAKMELKATDLVVELGCGWGGFAVRAAKTVGCRVRGYTLALEQIKWAQDLAKKLNLSDKCEFVCDDYRNATGPADHVVSIGMAEHVGHHFLGDLFKTADRVLKPGGKFMCHTITSCDRDYSLYRHQTGFMQHYIFPGCCIPAVHAIIDAMAQSSFELQHMENIGENYALTLREWRKNFYEKLPECRAQGHDQAFLRMWDFYLCNCEAEFLTEHMGLAHFIFTRKSRDPMQSISRLGPVPLSNKVK